MSFRVTVSGIISCNVVPANYHQVTLYYSPISSRAFGLLCLGITFSSPRTSSSFFRLPTFSLAMRLFLQVPKPIQSWALGVVSMLSILEILSTESSLSRLCSIFLLLLLLFSSVKSLSSYELVEHRLELTTEVLSRIVSSFRSLREANKTLVHLTDNF